MKVEVEALSSVKKIIHVEIPAEKVTQELDSMYKSLKKTAKLKGFRPGKVPRAVLENFYKKDVHEDVSGKLIQESFPEAIKETELNIIGNPVIDRLNFDDKGPYKYKATVEINPEIQDIDFKDISLKKHLYPITEAQIQDQLKMIQRNFGTLEPLVEDRPLQESDAAVIDYEVFQNGTPFAEIPKSTDYFLRVGNGQITPDFDDKITGLKPGQSREIDITFPEDYPKKAVTNQTVTFNVTLKEIRKEVLPEIDDDLAQKAGKYETLEDLKAAIHDNLKQGYDKRVEQELNEQIFSAIIEKTDFELPEALVEFEMNGILSEVERSFQLQNVSMEDLGLTRENLTEKYRETAENQARRHLILDKIIKQEELSLSDEALETGLKEMSESVNQPVEDLKAFYDQQKEQFEYFKHSLLEKQAINLIIENSHLTEVDPESEAEAETTAEK